MNDDTATGLEPDDADLDLPAPGWDAIDATLTAVYGSTQPTHVAYDPPMGRSDNLQGCSAYPVDGHWHYVTYGLSELYEPAPDADPAVSGWGFELTLRVPAGPTEVAPEWPFVIINEIAKSVNAGRIQGLAAGGRVDFRAPITGFPNLADAPDTGLTAYALTLDPRLGEILTPNGRVSFLQLVGVTAAEKELMLASSTAEVLVHLAVADPMLTTDPARA
ncbi:Suppressor of fused protein (SUFU) [Nakamurella panacisegetis]|uniref:Suppressor of fused protein (SUFU) n=1 Tax=Nakamurella panacisegetis TaxID=1090615 RepID=A0A1H0NNU0_9ACTN|nr:suppressor of fused domain protein [Nakamurella panacisegetis]SDO94075.1 Suppressor of fused protein (SUFU) [Nakamurella panacisegetis]